MQDESPGAVVVLSALRVAVRARKGVASASLVIVLQNARAGVFDRA